MWVGVGTCIACSYDSEVMRLFCLFQSCEVVGTGKEEGE